MIIFVTIISILIASVCILTISEIIHIIKYVVNKIRWRPIMSTATFYHSSGIRKIDIDLSKFKLEDVIQNNLYGTTNLYFIGPGDVLNKFYKKIDSTEINIEFITNSPHAQYPYISISPTKNGKDYDWCALYIEDFEAVHKLIDIGLNRLN